MKKFEFDEVKIMIIVSILCFFALVGFFIFSSLFSKGSPKTISKEYKKIVTANSLAKGSDFKEETSNKETQDNIKKSIELIKPFVLKRADIINSDKEKIIKDFDKSVKSINEEKYIESLDQTKNIIKDINTAISKYKQDHFQDFQDIGESVKQYTSKNYRLINLRIVDSWAVGTLVPPLKKTDPANVVFKKDSGKWGRILGPGTAINKNSQKLSGAPDYIIKSINVIMSEDNLLRVKLTE